MVDRATEDILSLIKTDHRNVDEFFARLETAQGADEIYKYFNQIYKELMLHAQAEEMVFYPALQTHDNTEGLVVEAKEEHDKMEALLEDVRAAKPGSNEFRTKLRELRDSVRHHVEEEEDQVFNAARRHMTAQELEALAPDFQAAKARVMDDVETAMVSSP